jgi:hypothetical protein
VGISYTDAEADGQAPEAMRSTAIREIRFGPRPTQSIKPEWADDILTALATKHPKMFGDLLREAMLGDGA